MNKIFFGRMKGGAISIRGHKDYRDDFYRNEGKECEIIFASKQKLLSDKQMRYYRGIVVKMIADRIGYSKYESGNIGYELCHQDLAKKFLSFEVKIGLSVRKYVKSTTTLSTFEMVEYIEFCRQWALEKLGLDIPDPDPNYYGEDILKVINKKYVAKRTGKTNS